MNWYLIYVWKDNLYTKTTMKISEPNPKFPVMAFSGTAQFRLQKIHPEKNLVYYKQV